jgi:hypothetical protein
MALISRGTHRVRTATTVAVCACLTGAAEVSIVAGDPICLGRLLAESSGVVAHSCVQAITGVGAVHGGGRYTDTRLAGLTVGAEAAVVADDPVGDRWIAAEARRGIAHTDLVALIQGRTDGRITGLADPVVAEVFYCTGVTVDTL